AFHVGVMRVTCSPHFYSHPVPQNVEDFPRYQDTLVFGPPPMFDRPACAHANSRTYESSLVQKRFWPPRPDQGPARGRAGPQGGQPIERGPTRSLFQTGYADHPWRFPTEGSSSHWTVRSTSWANAASPLRWVHYSLRLMRITRSQ